MHHPDEHTLELYVLGAPEVADRRGEVRDHLAMCAGCRELAATMERFYADLGEVRTRTRQPRRLLPAVRGSDGTFVEPFDSVHLRPRPRAPIDRFRAFARLHPLAAGGGATLVLAGIALALSFVIPRIGASGNPDYVVLNDGMGRFQVYGHDDDLVWEIPAPGADLKIARLAESDHGQRLSAVADLDGDGINEVITALPSLGDSGPQRNVLRIYDASKRLRSAFTLAEACTYQGRPYHAMDGIAALLVDDFDRNGSPEIFALGHGGRSPTVVISLDPDGTIRGTYWHYGLLLGMSDIDLDGDGMKEILAWGVNDVGEDTKENFGLLAVLDPSRIVGTTQSSATDGFGLARSTAEKWYIRLPRTDVSRALGLKSSVVSVAPLQYRQRPAISVWEEGTHDSGRFHVEYLLNYRMEALVVRPDDGGVRMREGLVARGLVTGPVDSAYLGKLRDGVRYFDGHRWRERPVSPLASLTPGR